MIDSTFDHSTDAEKARTEDLIRLVPRNRHSVIDVGARDGHFSRILTGFFDSVTALDLQKPSFDYPGVKTVAGDATRLEFEDNSFDCAFCAEVLEHIPDLRTACAELTRVARHEIIIGVPYKQDTRVGRTTCRECGKANPPWGHVNTFDERRFTDLFPGLKIVETSFAGASTDATNSLSAWLMDMAGNPYGTYDQKEPCIYCGAVLTPPPLTTASRVLAGLADRLTRLQSAFVKPHGNWIHLVLSKSSSRQ